MAVIPKNLTEGGVGLTPGTGTADLRTILQDIATDLAAGRGAALSAATVGADIGAFTDPPTALQMAALRTFVNALKADNADLRAKYSAVAAAALLTTNES